MGTLNMLSKEVQVTAIIRLKKQNRPLREIAETLGVGKATFWSNLNQWKMQSGAQQHQKAGKIEKYK